MEIVLYTPEIPQNTGSIARLCAATDTPLHLIEPLGFTIDDRHLKRAGLDYWPRVKLAVWPDFQTFLGARPTPPGRLVLSTSGNRGHAGTPYHLFPFQAGDLLVFGPESTGLPEDMLDRAGHAVRIPITKNVRSLNLANAASIILYEALRRLGTLPA
ncbi:MAG: tRNA (cytidine(34)-2'-O)-methyltransferase [Desulfovibrio sp.]|nr:tRNA (cytidine(34)-2'-O)-methyltransferase [Desulfovibrio sp.]